MELSKCYLVCYNTLLAIGWSIVLIKELSYLITGRLNVYASIETELKIFQTAAVLEIVHSAYGLVKSPVLTTVIQVFSRLFVLWTVIHNVSVAQASLGVVLCTLAWSMTEVIRYAFYAFNLLNCLPSVLLWLRYTLFIVLYPLGVCGELLVMYSALGEVKRRKIYTFEMPNPANVSFDYYYVLIFVMILYLPLFPRMYLYMFGQRKKYLGDGTDLRRKTN